MNKKWLGILSACLLTTNSFANEPQCLPENLIKQAKFTLAFEAPYQENIWFLISDAITFRGQEWNIWFGTILKDAKTPAEAIKQGQENFKLSPLSKPKSYTDKDKTICNYVLESMRYSVTAINPPEYSINSAHSFHSFKRGN